MRDELRDLLTSGSPIAAPGLAPRDPSASPLGEAGDMFVGRTDELAVLEAALLEARRGRPRTVLVTGAAGIGKTALVERFLHDASGANGVQVLRCGGERVDRAGFGVIDQLFRAAGLASVRLLAACGAGLPYFESTTVGAHLLAFLTERQDRGPVVLLVDDLQWADPESLQALLFALRRSSGGRLLTLLVTRDEVGGLADGLARHASRCEHAAVLRLGPLSVGEVRTLASTVTDGAVPAGVEHRLHTHTRGNPLHLLELLAELPTERWLTRQHVLPPTRAVARWVRDVVDMCSSPTRRLVEAASVLGDGNRLTTVASLAAVQDPLVTLESASSVRLLDLRPDPTGRTVVFPHPMVRAAVYEQLGPVRRAALHRAAADLVPEEDARLRHRVAVSDPPDVPLAARLSEFAERQAAVGEWSGAASALLDAAWLNGACAQQWRLRALDLLAAGGVRDHEAAAVDALDCSPGALRDAVLGHLALLDGNAAHAEELLGRAWQTCDPGVDRSTAALIAQRCALHSLGRLRPAEVVHWARRATALAPADGPSSTAADALLALGLGWSGVAPGPAGIGSEPSPSCAHFEPEPSPFCIHFKAHFPGCAHVDHGIQSRIGRGALWTATDDIDTARAELADAMRVEHRLGPVAHRVWAYVWLSRAEFLAGAWDEAETAAARAVWLVEGSGHKWLRPLVRWAAATVPAARGDWTVAQEHARSAAAHGGHYELMLLGAGLAGAQLAAARGDHDEVLRALAPVVRVWPREGVDEPGFWPWQAFYGDALVSAGRLADAEAFLGPHEELAAARDRPLSVAMLAGVRGRLEAAAGRAEASEVAFGRGLAQLAGLSMPFPRGLLELAYGQVLRRHGQRRAAAEWLQQARERFVVLGARPFVERCERELSASGSVPAVRRDCDPGRLTAQELAVARLVGTGLSNRQVASELFISVKTVQFHLTHIYAKLRVGSRAELAASYGERLRRL